MDEPVDLDDPLYERTWHLCAACEGDVQFTEEVVQVQMVEAREHAGGLHYFPVLAPDGQCPFVPLYLHFECWEPAYEALRTLLDDAPPVRDLCPDLVCATCGSDVRRGEYLVLWTFGELHRSSRSPNGQTSLRFEELRDPEPLCTYCATLLSTHDEGIELWDTPTQYGECGDCTHARCWRQTACACRCHEDL